MAGVPYRAIAESTYDWETWIDESGRVRWVNAAVERLTGHSVASCLRMKGFPLALVHEADRARIGLVLERGARGEAGNDVEFRVLRADGAELWVAISWQPLRDDDGTARGFRTSVRDIHERKSAEEKLRQAERRARERAAEQAEMLATLSHELRSPLHCISGFGELLMRAELPPESRRYIGIVQEQSEAALRLVEDLLHFVALAEAAPVLRPTVFDLARLVTREVDALRPRVRKDVALHVVVDNAASGFVEGDADRVRQVVANLIGNAVRFTERGEIVVRLGYEGGAYAIEVRDTGIGMSQALLARVKQPFVQAAGGAVSRGGVGLGLAIVDRLAAAMGGSVSIRSEEGAGTSVHVRLALTRSLTGPAATPEVKETKLTDVRVLVVDDSDPSRELLAAMLETLGCEVTTAESGRVAIERVQEVPFDLVLLDYHMPELDGRETAQRIRALGLASVPRLVMLTANVLAEAFHDPGAHGLDLVLPKPVRLAQLRELAEGGATVSEERPLGDVVDHDVAQELCAVRDAAGVTLLARTLPRVEAHVQWVIARVREDLAVDDTLLREVHSLKGLVASVGAQRAAEHAADLEEALRRNAPRSSVTAALDALAAAYTEAHAALTRLARR